MCPASLSLPRSECYCGGDEQDAELLSDKNGKGQKCPARDEEMWCNYGDAQADWQPHTLGLTHGDRATSSSPWQHQCYCVPWKKTLLSVCQIHNCPWDLAGLLYCRREESPAPPQHGLGALWMWRTAQPADQATRALLASLPAQGLQQQSQTTVHFWRQKWKHKPAHSEKEHCQHVCTVFTTKEKKKPKKPDNSKLQNS